jgi:hypothetical protein
MNQLPNAPQTLGWEPLDSRHILACPRVAVESVLHLMPEKYILAIREYAPSECCHSVINLEVEAWYSGPDDEAKGVPDLYKFYCKECDRCHVRFCIGGNHPTDPAKLDKRPFWEVR